VAVVRAVGRASVPLLTHVRASVQACQTQAALVQSAIDAKLLPRRAQLVQAMQQIHVRIGEVHAAKSGIERGVSASPRPCRTLAVSIAHSASAETREELEGSLGRLAAAEGEKLAVLQQDLDVLTSELASLDAFARSAAVSRQGAAGTAVFMASGGRWRCLLPAG
jgi:hypothetical protein